MKVISARFGLLMISLLINLASCHTSSMSKSMKAIADRQDAKKSETVQAYDAAVKRHMKMQSKEARKRIRKDQKEAKKRMKNLKMDPKVCPAAK